MPFLQLFSEITQVVSAPSSLPFFISPQRRAILVECTPFYYEFTDCARLRFSYGDRASVFLLSSSLRCLMIFTPSCTFFFFPLPILRNLSPTPLSGASRSLAFPPLLLFPPVLPSDDGLFCFPKSGNPLDPFVSFSPGIHRSGCPRERFPAAPFPLPAFARICSSPRKQNFLTFFSLY